MVTYSTWLCDASDNVSAAAVDATQQSVKEDTPVINLSEVVLPSLNTASGFVDGFLKATLNWGPRIYAILSGRIHPAFQL